MIFVIPDTKKPTQKRKAAFSKVFVKKKLEKILLTGQLLSNVAFNLSQSDSTPKDIASVLKSLQVDWDKELVELPLWMRK
jgi:hypothetical protein